MATKKRHEEPNPASSRNAIIVLALGGLAVAALVVWALTRTVETTESAPVASTTFSEQIPPPSTTQPSATEPGLPPITATQTTFPSATPPAIPPAAPAAQGEDPASIPRMSVEDLREQARAQTVTIIDVRDTAAYGQEHIPGAIHIPFARIEGEMGSLAKNKPIVLYCT